MSASITVWYKYDEEGQAKHNGYAFQSYSLQFGVADLSDAGQKALAVLRQAQAFPSASPSVHLGTHKPSNRGLQVEEMRFADPPTLAEVERILVEMAAAYPNARKEADRLVEEFRRENVRSRKEMDERIQREREESQRKHEAARLKAMVIDWQDDGTAICDLYDAVVACSDERMDARHNNWVKRIDSVNREKANGYMLDGEFVNEGTVEIKKARAVYLVAATTGSRRYQTTTYRVVLMTADGLLERTGITTNNSSPGWSLRIRNAIEALLAD